MKGFLRTMWLIALLAGLLALWFSRLKEHQKNFLRNLVRQAPELPGRYAI
jgi:hypothetical protein